MNAFPFPEVRLAHRVSYGETDTMKVLYYAEYLHLFERARSQYIRERGMSYAVAEERGLFLPVREASCRYRSPARYDDLLYIRAGISAWGRASLTFVYELLNEDQTKLLAEGMTMHACVNDQGRPIPVPDWFRALVGGEGDLPHEEEKRESPPCPRPGVVSAHGLLIQQTSAPRDGQRGTKSR